MKRHMIYFDLGETWQCLKEHSHKKKLKKPGVNELFQGKYRTRSKILQTKVIKNKK